MTDRFRLILAALAAVLPLVVAILVDRWFGVHPAWVMLVVMPIYVGLWSSWLQRKGWLRGKS